MIIDLHTHTKPWSDDSKFDLPGLIERAKQVGLDAICITEHDWWWKRDVIEKVSREHNFLVLPGVETNTDDGHFLVYGLDKYTFGMYRTAFLRELVEKVGGVMILAHPYRRNLNKEDDVCTKAEAYCQKPFWQYVDILETHNGRASERESQFSREICRRLNLKSVGGSDAHCNEDLPACATCFERNITCLEDLIAEMKAGRFHPVDFRICQAAGGK